MRRLAKWSIGGAAAAAVTAALCLGGSALAQSPAPGSGGTLSPVNQCSLQGTLLMPKDLIIYDQYQGGSAIAKFTGAKTTLTAHHFPLDPTRGRVSIRTGAGRGGFRIDGYIDPTKLPIFTQREITVHAGHIWIGKAQRVEFVKATASDFRVKHHVKGVMQQSFTAQAGCGEFTLTPGVPPGWPVPGNARGYVVKKSLVELYDDGGKDRGYVDALRQADGLLMWSTKRRGAFVNVQYHGSVVIDAWARASDFRLLPWGEREDRQAPPIVQRQAPQLGLAETPREVTATSEVPLQSQPKAGGPVIGAIETGAQVYVLDIVVGWANVMPKSLNLAPHQNGGFWAEASKLGLGSS